MGTLLYAKGIFINRSYDELNLSQPDLIRGIHHDYLQSGAEIIETNTFGGNAFRLGRHSLADKVRDVNLTGARLAREAAKSFDVWVAGSVGPLGTRIEPLGKTSFQEARDAFREQIQALVEGGVDLLMLETFGYLEELHQALLAAKDVGASLPIVAQVTSTKTAIASTAPTRKHSLANWKNGAADVIGCNCSVGPVAMLDAIERVRAATSLPLAAQPNAGIPRSVDGRNIYLCSPEYMASYARKFVAAGVGLSADAGDHSRTHTDDEVCPARWRSPGKGRFDQVRGAAASSSRPTTLENDPFWARSWPVANSSPWSKSFLRRERHSKEIEGARFLKSVGVDVVNIPDSPRASARMSNQALSLLVQRTRGSRRSCTTLAATATCSAFRATFWGRLRSASRT